MTHATFVLEARVIDLETKSPVAGDKLESFVDALIGALLELEAGDALICDPNVGAVLAKGLIEVELSVEADRAEDAVAHAFSTIRAAVHATGAHTPGWDLDVVRQELLRDDQPDGKLIDA